MRLLFGTRENLRDVTSRPEFGDQIQYMQIMAEEVNVKNVVETHKEYEPEVRLVLETDSAYPYTWEEDE